MTELTTEMRKLAAQLADQICNDTTQEFTPELQANVNKLHELFQWAKICIDFGIKHQNAKTEVESFRTFDDFAEWLNNRPD